MTEKVPVPANTYTQNSFRPAFARDIEGSHAFIFIDTAYISIKGVQRFSQELSDAVARGVRVCCFVQTPQSWERRNDPNLDVHDKLELNRFIPALKSLEELGIHVTLRDGLHTKVAVFDYRITWSGSLNILSYTGKTEEEIYRWEDEDWAKDTVKRRDFDNCKQCVEAADKTTLQLSQRLNAHTIGDDIFWLRAQKGLSQRELAELVGVTRAHIARIEAGRRCPGADLLIRIYQALDKPLHMLSPQAIPLLERWRSIN